MFSESFTNPVHPNPQRVGRCPRSSGQVRERRFLTGPQNYRSQRAVEKIGGLRDGTSRNGAGRDSFVYRITASAFVRADPC